jgi:hypothetical protein
LPQFQTCKIKNFYIKFKTIYRCINAC